MTDIVERYCFTDSPDCLGAEYRAEIERLRTDYGLLSDDYKQLQIDNERLRAHEAELYAVLSERNAQAAEIERLRTDNRSLRSALKQAMTILYDNDCLARHILDYFDQPSTKT